jgi:hypothetical protein
MTRSSWVLLFACIIAAPGSPAREGAGSVVLTPASDLEWVANERGASFSYPWKEDDGSHGDVIRFPSGFDSGPHTHTAPYRGVVIQGVLMNPAERDTTSVPLSPGSTWFVAPGVVHSTKCVSDRDCLFYVHREAAFDFKPVQ